MVFKCTLLNCNATKINAPGVRFYTFPKNKDLKNKWINAIGGRKDMNPLHKEAMRVCSRHFDKNCINRLSKMTRLIKNSIPTLYLTEDTFFEANVETEKASDEANDKTEQGPNVVVTYLIGTDAEVKAELEGAGNSNEMPESSFSNSNVVDTSDKCDPMFCSGHSLKLLQQKQLLDKIENMRKRIKQLVEKVRRRDQIIAKTRLDDKKLLRDHEYSSKIAQTNSQLPTNSTQSRDHRKLVRILIARSPVSSLSS